ncbi:MAG: WYL domain-containing protein, partial [Oscillospiraceae bacterium]|nr:WYL domain-containing protein [Oscillospiraceae bacterium]
IEARVKFDKSVKWRVIDEFGTELPDFEEDGSARLTFTWSDVPSFYQYILSFGDKAEIISPDEYRREFSTFLQNILEKYQ